MQFAASLFKCAVEASSTAMAILLRAGTGRCGMYVNAAFEELTGFTADDIGHRGLELLHGEETDPHGVAQLQASVAEGRELRLLIRSYRKDGTWFWNLLHVMPLHDEGRDAAHCLLMLRDVTEQRSSVERLVRRAHQDPLTGLANRHVFYDRVDHVIAQAQLEGGSFALVFVDINRFKQINDTFGHETGDEILKLVGARLTHGARVGDTVCRVGGDEFVLLLPLMPAGIDVEGVRSRVSHALERPVLVDGRRLQLSCSIGISVYPTDGRERSSLFRSADLDMYRNKPLHNPAAGRHAVAAKRERVTANLH